MENQRQIAAVNLGPTPINPPDNTGNAAWQNRPRGWSNETSRNSRGPLRHYGRYGNHHQNQHFSHYNDRRTMPNTPRSSSPRQGSSADPIYVLQPQRSSPPYHQNHIRGQRTASQPLPQNLRRIFSDSSTDSTGFPNDPRVKDSVATQAKTQNPQVSSIQLNIPFEGNPQASFNPVNNVSSFFYRGEPRKIQYDDESRRTVYVSGIEVRQFISHAFKEMMSECGEVDYISYLLGRTNNSGPAFVR
jgi:hypothetical protein